MDIVISIFNTILYFPLFNALIWLYSNVAFRDLGIAILFLTFLIRFILYPLSRKAIQSQHAISALQPKIKKIQTECKNKEEQAQQIMALYKEHKVNPMAGCLPILIQFPILIALYRVFFTGLDPQKLSGLYNFVERPETINYIFLGLIDLSQKSIALALTAGCLQFIQSKMLMPRNKAMGKNSNFSSMMGQQMTYFMPMITILIAWNLPAALPLYWIAVTSFGIVQQYFTTRSMKNMAYSPVRNSTR